MNNNPPQFGASRHNAYQQQQSQSGQKSSQRDAKALNELSEEQREEINEAVSDTLHLGGQGRD